MRKYLPLLSLTIASAIYANSADAQSKFTVMGNNGFGQLGTTALNGNRTTPYLLDSTATTDWIYVSSETLSNLALKADGSLWAWGRNVNGQLGDGTKTNILVPTLIDSGTNQHGKWVKIDQGGTTGIGIRADGSLWAWGSNAYGKLGLGIAPSQLAEVTSPMLIDSGNNVHGRWVHVDNGLSHTVGIREDGTTWAWGWNSNGQLGINQNSDRYEPTLVDSGTNWGGPFVNINSTAHFNIAIKENGSLWAWGMNTNKEVGKYFNNTIPVCLDSAHYGKWTSISAGFNHSIAMKEDSTIWGWGKNAAGQLLGINPVEVDTLTQLGTDKWKMVEVGQNNAFGIKADGTFWAWGANTQGQLGIGTTNNVSVMTPIPELDQLMYPIISSGLQHTVILERYLPDAAITTFLVSDRSTDSTRIQLEWNGTISNVGSSFMDSALVSLSINGTTVKDTVVYNLNAQDSLHFNEPLNWTPDTAGTYTFCLKISKVALMEVNTQNNQQCNNLDLAPHVTPPTSINNLDAKKVVMYPNPAKEWVNIETEQPLEKLNIIDISGRTVVEYNNSLQSNTSKIHIGELQNGLYLLQIIFEDGTQAVQKLNIK